MLATFAFLLAAATPRPAETTHLKLIVGVTDDTAKWMSRQDGIVGVHRDLQLMAVRVTDPVAPRTDAADAAAADLPASDRTHGPAQ